MTLQPFTTYVGTSSRHRSRFQSGNLLRVGRALAGADLHEAGSHLQRHGEVGVVIAAHAYGAWSLVLTEIRCELIADGFGETPALPLGRPERNGRSS